MEINERINKLLEYSGLSVNKFSEKIGVKTSQAIRDLLSGKTKSISRSIEDKILSCFTEIDRVWLLTGEGPMLKSSIGNQDEVKMMQPSNVMMVPLVSQYAHAGYMSGFADNGYMDSLPKMPFPMDEEHHGEYVCFEVRGDSMDDGMRHSYAQGDIVLCRNVDKLYWMKKLHYNSWNAFVIVHKDGIVLKQIVAHDVERGVITVHSYNPYYEDFDIDLRDVYQILNVVKTQRNG